MATFRKPVFWVLVGGVFAIALAAAFLPHHPLDPPPPPPKAAAAPKPHTHSPLQDMTTEDREAMFRQMHEGR